MEKFTVRSYEADSFGKLKIPTLVNWLEESASNNARSLGASVHDLLIQNISWVMYRMSLTIHRLPALKEVVHIDTWPSGIDKYFTYRDFIVYDHSQNIIATATTHWVVLDMVARKMIAIPDFIHAIGFVANKQHLPKVNSKFKPSKEAQVALTIKVLKGDLDQNLHANNARYFQWILEVTPQEHEAKSPKLIDVIFKAEAHAGNDLDVLVAKEGDMAISSIIKRSTDGNELVHARVEF